MVNEQKTQGQRWYDKTWVVVVLLILFFPVGLYATWKNTRYKTRTKAIITGVVCLALLIGFAEDQRVKSELEQADNHWSSGERIEAVRIYKEFLNANVFAIPQEKRPTVFQRVIEYDVEQGNLSAAKQAIMKSNEMDIPLAFQAPEASRFYSSVQQEIYARAEQERYEQQQRAQANRQQGSKALSRKELKAARDLRDKGMLTDKQYELLRNRGK